MTSSNDSVRSRRWGMLLGLDLVAALIVGMGLIAVLPTRVPLRFAADVYGIATSSLAIIFSVFVAALATIVSASDNDFVAFLEEDKTFGDILFGMSLTLFALFGALIASGAAYILSSWQVALGEQDQNRWLAITVGVLLSYALGSALSSTRTTIKLASLRARFVHSSADPDNGKG